jgi:hypothetical protein
LSFWARFEAGYTRHGKWSMLSDDAFRFGHKVIDWCCENETAFIPARSLYDLAGTPARGRRLAKELQECGRHFDPPKAGILDPLESGWAVHNFPKYAPPGFRERAVVPPPAKPIRPEVSAARSEAGRLGAAARLAKLGKPEANEPSKTKQTPKQNLAKPEAKPGLPPHTPPSQNGNGYGPEQTELAKTSQVYARSPGGRPIVRTGLLDAKISPRTWVVPDDFFAYGMELGLSPNEAHSAVTDFKEKFERQGTVPWLADKLCGFIEQAVKSKTAKRSTSPEDQSETLEDVLARIDNRPGVAR